MSREDFMHWFLKFVFGLGILVIIYWFISYSLPKLLPTQYIKDGTVSGLVFSDQVWEGTIRVRGDLWYVKGSLVTVRPGTIIIVSKDQDKFNFDFLPWHLKSGVNIGPKYHGIYTGEPFWDESQKIQIHFGYLSILGTKEQPVILKSDSNLGSPYDFNSISANSGIVSYLKGSNYRRFEIGDNFTLRDSHFSNIGECAVCITEGKPVVANNTFEQSLREYIWISGASPRISDNFFMKSSGAGIKIDPQKTGKPLVLHNDFEMPQSSALEILTGDEIEGGTIAYNNFSGNSIIKLTCDSKAEIVQNSILGLVHFRQPGCSNSFTFGPNYWGAQDKKTILSDKFLGKEKKFNISIPEILKSPPVNVGKRS